MQIWQKAFSRILNLADIAPKHRTLYIMNIIISMSRLFQRMHRLYIILFRSKFGYASVVWNSITSTQAKKLERIQ
jgi:hypothetical protein